MLSYLRIRGLALLDDVALELGGGLNVLTGETGAGKSIIIDALTLLRGVRSRAELVRAGESAATVDAAFELQGSTLHHVRGVLSGHGLPAEEAAGLVLSRVAPRSGRGRVMVQGELTTQSVLGEIGEELLDVCSQHEHHSLTRPARHLELLDAYGRLEADVAEYGEAYRAWREAVDELSALRERARDGGQRADFLRFQIEELTRVAPESGEYAELSSRLELVRDAHQWAAFAASALDVLNEADDSVVARLSVLAEQARRGAQASARLSEMAGQLEAARIACGEAVHLAERLADSVEIEPGELDRIEARMSELESLRRKHGVEVDQLGERLDEMRAELAGIDGAEDAIAALEEQVSKRHAAARKLALMLSERRRASAKRLAKALCVELSELSLPGARLEAVVETLSELSPRGLDAVELSFSANVGEPLAPLTRVASGGELSRVLLAIKGVLSTGDSVATYVFDEVDAGVGGAVAEAIGRRLTKAADGHQVLCITHLPQIAAFADRHFRVEKTTENGRTLTRVRRLSEEESVEEIARMLGGATITDSARRHARALREQARGRAPAKVVPLRRRAAAPRRRMSV
ncbi:MAG: DNA repair protein RecN [Polyangiaceae bacterium]|nr:DNA repair protein RecN [Polyangiaceae bacterium]